MPTTCKWCCRLFTCGCGFVVLFVRVAALVGHIKAIVLFLVYLSRLDKCFALSGHENLDHAYKSFLGFLQVEAYYANPTLRVFIHLLQHRRRGIVSRARTRWLLAYTLLNNPLLRVWRRREKQECLRDSADATDSDSNSENSEAQSGGCCGKQQASTPVRFKASRESEILAQLAFHEQQIRKLHRELAASSAAPTAFSQQLGSAHESTGEDQAAHAGNATPGYLDVTSTLVRQRACHRVVFRIAPFVNVPFPCACLWHSNTDSFSLTCARRSLGKQHVMFFECCLCVTRTCCICLRGPSTRCRSMCLRWTATKPTMAPSAVLSGGPRKWSTRSIQRNSRRWSPSPRLVATCTRMHAAELCPMLGSSKLQVLCATYNCKVCNANPDAPL